MPLFAFGVLVDMQVRGKKIVNMLFQTISMIGKADGNQELLQMIQNASPVYMHGIYRCNEMRGIYIRT